MRAIGNWPPNPQPPLPDQRNTLKSTSRFIPRRQSSPSLAGCASPALNFGALEPADCGEKQQEIAERGATEVTILFSAERIVRSQRERAVFLTFPWRFARSKKLEVLRSFFHMGLEKSC
jgi:hypothetical protein